MELREKDMRDLREMAELMARLPPVRREIVTPELTMGGACGCTKALRDFPPVRTPLAVVFDNVCRDCPRRKEFDGTAALVCLTCRKVFSRLTPWRKDSGFMLRSGGFYHMRECPVCHPGKEHFDILEEDAWTKQRR